MQVVGGGYVLNGLYKSGYENVYGFDVSESGIKVAKENFINIRDRFEVHSGYDYELQEPFSSINYDIVLSVEVIEHLYSPKSYLKNIKGWLKENGYLILTTPYHGYLKNLAISLSNRFDGHFTPLWEGGHITFFSKNTLYSLLEQTGFEILKFYGSGRLPYLWKSMVVVAQKI